MEYALAPALCAESALQSMRMNAQLNMTRGEAALTPTSVQWVLRVSMKANGAIASFDMIENLLRCFVAGNFMTNWARENEAPMYEQESAGFRAVFSRGRTFPPATAGRREVKAINIDLEFLHKQHVVAYVDHDTLFQDTLELADYAFSAWMHSLQTIAPAVFTGRYKRISSTQQFLRPLKLALDLPRDSSVLEQIAERAVLGVDRCRQGEPLSVRQEQDPLELDLVEPTLVGGLACDEDAHDVVSSDTAVWDAPGQYFRSMPFEARKFVVLTGDNEEVHECVFLNQLVPRE